MRRRLALILALAFVVVPAVQAAPTTVEWTGYITDTHCGPKGATKDHTIGCVERCVKAGSKAQILNESDQKVYDLDDVAKVKSLVGKKVTIKGTLDAEKNTIKVESAAEAKTEGAAETK